MEDKVDSHLDNIVRKLQTIYTNPTKDEGERLHDSVKLIHAYLSEQPDREKAYRTLRDEIQKHKELNDIYAHI